MLPTSAGVEPATSWSPVGRASNWAIKAGFTLWVYLFIGVYCGLILLPSDSNAQRSFKSACATSLFVQNLPYTPEETLHHWLSKMRPVKNYIRLCICAGSFESPFGGYIYIRRYVCFCSTSHCSAVGPYFSRNGFLTRVKNSVGFVTRREEFDRIFHSCRTYSSPICDKLVRYQFYI